MVNRPRSRQGRSIGQADASSQRFSHRAKHFWERIPEDIRHALLANVWCSKCAGSTTIVDFRGTIDGGDLILRGSCSRCGAEVARHIESS